MAARDARAAHQTQQELVEAWLTGLAHSGLPVAMTDGARPRRRVIFGAPLPVGMTAGGELIDVILAERLPVWRVREALEAHAPAGWRVLRLHDVWVGGPPLPGRIVAADHRIDIAAVPDPARLVAAAAELLGKERIDRERIKGDSRVAYDLRPLLLDVRVVVGDGVTALLTRTRVDPALGSGRPDEVLAALAECAGMGLEATSTIRERLLLAEDL